MLASQKLKNRSDELKVKLLDLQLVEGNLDDAQRESQKEMMLELRDCGGRIEAAKALEDLEANAETRPNGGPVDEAERKEWELRSSTSLLGYFMPLISGRAPSGAEREYQQHRGLDTNEIPLDVLDDGDWRERTDVVTASPGTKGINLAPIVPKIFANSVASKLGITMPSVGSGTYSTATVDTSLTAGTFAPGGEAMATALTFTQTNASPKRIAGRLAIRPETVAEVGQANFEPVVRANLGMVMSEQLDLQLLSGAGAGNDLIGIFERLTDPTTTPSAVADFDYFAGIHAGGVDGVFAETIRQVAVLVGVDTMQLAGQVFQSAASYKGETSAASYAQANTGGFAASARMPDAVSTVQEAILYRSGQGMTTALAPQWASLSIDDVYTGSSSGERYLSLHVLVGDVILTQPGAYAQVRFKVS